MANVKKNLKFRYFQVLLVENGEKRTFPFSLWAQEINKRGLLQTCIESVEKIRVDDITYKDNIWGTRIEKLRDTDLPGKAKDRQPVQPVDLEEDEYLGEDIFMIYDEDTGIALIQQNRMSLGITKLQTFLCKTYREWCKNLTNAQVEISGILDTKELNKDCKGDYKSLQISFANIREESCEGMPLESILNMAASLDGLTANIKIGLGHSRGKSLNKERIIEVIKSIRSMGRGVVRGAKLSVKNDFDADIEVIDLFEEIYHEFIVVEYAERGLIGYEQIIPQMRRRYIFRKEELLLDLGQVTICD